MPTYWDSTALLNALTGQTGAERLKAGDHVTRSHAFVEAFHHLTGLRGVPVIGGGRKGATPDDGARMVRELSTKFKLRDLDLGELIHALEDAGSRGVSGRMVHDWIHVRAAKLARAELILTLDKGLAGLAQSEGLKAELP